MSQRQNLIEETSTNWTVRAFEDQTEWNRVLYIWKSFKAHESNLIQSYIGLSLFGPVEGQDDVNMETYFHNYDKNRRKLIHNIYKQLRYDSGRVILAQTYLYLSYKNQRISVFRRLKPNGGVEFIDVIGRVYTSWDHFVRTNELPSCVYLAPDDGVYKVNGNLKFYSSPRTSAGSRILNAGDVVASTAALGAVGLSMLAVAPLTALTLGVGGTAYCVGRSIGSLVDRSKHNQSIALDNMESVLSWLSIGTSAITGISTIGLMNSSRIIALSGEYSTIATTALKGLNYATLTSNVLNFGAYLVHFQEKLRAGELSTMDMMELCVNVFLIYGAVTNVRQMHKYLNSINASSQTSSTSLSGLSKTAKRKLQRLRAKARKSGLPIPGSNATENVMEVSSSWDINLSNMASTSASLLSSILMRHFPSAYQIYCKCRDIIDSVLDYRSSKLTLQGFIFNMTNHVSNLYQILKKDMEKIMNIVKPYMEKIIGTSIPRQAVGQVTEIIQNGVMAVNEVNDDLPGVESLDIDDSASDTDELVNNKPYYETILEAVKERLNQMCSITNTFEEVLNLYGEILSSISEQIISKIEKGYEEMLSFNHGAIGEHKTKALLSKIGINSRKDFGNNKFLRIIGEIKLHSEPPPNPFAPTNILKELFTVYRNFIISCSDVLNADAEKTAIFLNKSVSVFIKPLTEKFVFVKTFYQNNASHFGSENGMAMLLGALDLDPSSYTNREPNDLLFFDIAFGLTDILKFATSVAEMKENNEMETYEVQEFSNDFVTLNFLSLCACFYQKVYPNKKAFKPESEKQFKKASYFIMNKFTDTFKSLEQSSSDSKNISSKLERNTQFFSKSDFIRLCQSFNEINKREIFDQVMKKFANEKFTEELIEEYHNEMDRYDDVNVEVWKELVADDGMKIHTVDVSKYAYTREYINIAADLYGLSPYSISVVSKTENLIVLKTINTFIMFQFEESDNIAFAMQVDLSVVNQDG